ncbi:hypothetical protein D3C84_877360 [compost metagenome]
MVTTNIAISRQAVVLLRRCIFKYFQVSAVSTAYHLEIVDRGTRMYIQMPLHPIVLELELAEFEISFAAEYLYKKIRRFTQVWYGNA